MPILSKKVIKKLSKKLNKSKQQQRKRLKRSLLFYKYPNQIETYKKSSQNYHKLKSRCSTKL